MHYFVELRSVEIPMIITKCASEVIIEPLLNRYLTNTISKWTVVHKQLQTSEMNIYLKQYYNLNQTTTNA